MDNSKEKDTIKQQNLLVHILNTLICPIVLPHPFWTYILSFYITQHITSWFYSVCIENWLWFLHYIMLYLNTVLIDFIILVLLAQLFSLSILCFLEALELL